jgi:hypothetical protein
MAWEVQHMTAEPTTAPEGYLDVVGLDEVTFRELADRRTWLLDVITAAGPGTNNAGARTSAVVLSTVLNELDTRARTYKAAAGHSYSCTCGFQCVGLAAFDDHMDNYPPGSPDSQAHQEL